MNADSGSTTGTARTASTARGRKLGPRFGRLWAAYAVSTYGTSLGFGPVATVLTDAVSYLLSALGVRSIGGTEPEPPRPTGPKLCGRDLFEGWRHIRGHPTLRPLFLNAITVNGLIMATEPLLALLLLRDLGLAPWQYGLVFAVPCIGGLVGSRLAHRLVTRFGRHRVLRTAGTLRACWPLGLAFAQPGVPGIVLIMVLQFGLVTCCGLFNPVLATYRLTHSDPDRLARTLAAWSVSGSAAIAALTAGWGLLAALTGPRIALAAAGVLLLATPLLLPRREIAPPRTGEEVPGSGSALSR